MANENYAKQFLKAVIVYNNSNNGFSQAIVTELFCQKLTTRSKMLKVFYHLMSNMFCFGTLG